MHREGMGGRAQELGDILFVCVYCLCVWTQTIQQAHKNKKQLQAPVCVPGGGGGGTDNTAST